MRRVAVITVLFLSLLLTSCRITLTPVGGGSTASCPSGTWQVSSASINTLVAAFGTKLSVQLSGAGVTATITADGTWSLTANQSATVSGVSLYGPVSGTAQVNATASGTYTRTATAMRFTARTLTGSAAYQLTVNGTPLSGTLQLPGTNSDDNELEIEDFYGLSGTAGFQCDGTGTLTLTFPGFNLKFRH
jgi:hypothetical protein